MTQLYPAVLDPKTLTRQVWDTSTARRIPGVARALGLTSGLISQMPLDLMSGIVPLERPRLLEQPDTDYVLPTWLQLQLDDYLLQGNAAHLITARNRDGWPAAVRWFPAHQWHVEVRDGRRRYFLNGREVPRPDVIHVQRGADPLNPARGMGVVEEHVRTFDRVALQEESERSSLYTGAVPSVAIMLPPDDDSTEEELDDAADEWLDRFGGVERRPGFLPHGTEIKTLAWSPTDQEATDARNMSLVDVANVFNMDGYWLGAKTSSHTYRSPGPLFLAHLRTTLEPIMRPFEATWSLAWVPRGKRVVFDRAAYLADDLATTMTALTKATGGPIMTPDEARIRVQLGPIEGGDTLRSATTAADPDPDPDDVEDDTTTTQEGDQE